MYIPKHFQSHNRQEALAFMGAYSFAAIITSENEVPVATHLPFIVETRGENIVLSSHLAKPNPQHQHFTEKRALVIFTEPHAYISPKFYSKELNVPTWNYLSVHAYGRGVILDGDEQCLHLLEKMIVQYETAYLEQWQKLPMDYKRKMLQGIVAFEIHVDELQFKKKLSQNKTREERHRVISAFENSASENERTIAQYMQTPKS